MGFSIPFKILDSHPAWHEMKWSWDGPSWGNSADTSSVFWLSLNSLTQLMMVSSLLLNSTGSTLGWLRLGWRLARPWEAECLYL